MLQQHPLQEYVLHLVVTFPPRRDALKALNRSDCWKDSSISEPKVSEYLARQYVPTFHGLMLSSEKQPEVARLERVWDIEDNAAQFSMRTRSDTPTLIAFRLESSQMFLFSKDMGGFGLVTLAVRILVTDLPLTVGHLNLVGEHLRMLGNNIADADGQTLTMLDLVRTRVLGPEVVSSDTLDFDPVKASKASVFVVADLLQLPSRKEHEALLFGIASFTLSGPAGHGHSSEYLEAAVACAVAPFDNYRALTLLDSFVVIGNNVLAEGGKVSAIKKKTWSETYLAIYVFNLYIKYRCQQLAADLYDTASRRRDAATHFLSRYALARISSNFLPRLIHQDMWRGLEIKAELKALRRQLTDLSALIEEDGNKRQSALLAIVSLFGAAEGLPALFDVLPEAQQALGLGAWIFWPLATILFLSVALALLWYLFPDRVRYLRKRRHARIRQRRQNPVKHR